MFRGYIRLSVVVCGLAQFAAAATICVNKNPASGCLSTISAAVTAASPGDVIQVAQGTYHESVVIGKRISLVGANSSNTIVDATGLPTGFNVDGLNHGGLSDISISGFKVQNANFEGIVVTNASRVTISGNQVLKNNINLNINTVECPGIPDWETAEGFDCGEGIHLSGVDHSVVANNFVANNAGGILLSDDTGATHDNLILNNTVQDNPFDCGITLASHPLAGAGPTAAGVFHNTITGNISQHNGFQVPGAGAGVGLFSPAPFTKNYGNVVVNNTLTDNGLPGVSMHAHSPGATLTDQMIAANHISANGADTDDTATSGPTGVNVSGGDNGHGAPLAVLTGMVIAGNVIDRESIAIATKTNSVVQAVLNNFNTTITGVDNIATGSVDAILNWWGCAHGPGAPGCAGVIGTNIAVLPFLTNPF